MARILSLNLGDAALQAKAKAKLEADYTEASQNKAQYEQILQAVSQSHEVVSKHLGKTDYTKKEVSAIKTEDPGFQQNIAVLLQMFNFSDSIPDLLEEVKDGIKHFTDQLNYNLNVNFSGRDAVGDNPYDLMDLGYGDGNPKNRFPDEDHGTHVAGIIAATLIVNLIPMHTPEDLWFIFLCGFVAICAMILPGVSGAFLLLVMGLYQPVLRAIDYQLAP